MTQKKKKSIGLKTKRYYDHVPLYCNFVFTLQKNGLHVHKAKSKCVNVEKLHEMNKQTPMGMLRKHSENYWMWIV